MRDEGSGMRGETLDPHPSSLPIDLLQEVADRRVELRVAAALPAAEGAIHVNIDRARCPFQVLASQALHRDPRETVPCAIQELPAPGPDHRAGGRLADDLPQAGGPVAF